MNRATFTKSIIIAGLVTQIVIWSIFLLPFHRHPFGAVGTAFQGVSALIPIAGIILVVIDKRSSKLLIAVILLIALSTLIQDFSYLYWSDGSTANFNISLTRLDALYFALGTLTTAGTGSINAMSDTARAVQSLQMTLDLILIVFAIGLVIARFSSRPE